MKKHNKNKYKAKNQDTQDKKVVDSGKENPSKDQPGTNLPGGKNIIQGKTAEVSDVKQEIKKEQAVLEEYAASESVSFPQDSLKDKPKETKLLGATPLGTEKDKAKDKDALSPKVDEPIYPAGFHMKNENTLPTSTASSKSKTTTSNIVKDKAR